MSTWLRASLKLLSVVGARPQFIKAAMVSQAIARLPRPRGVRHRLVHTGQHFEPEMSEVFFRDLPLPAPAYHLGLGGPDAATQLGRMIERLAEVYQQERPDAVLVYGDTTSTLAGALAASLTRMPVAHVEAGLRSFNRAMPEEVNRVLTDHLSRWLFCPTQTAVKNLAAEGVIAGVHLVGDVMVDALRQASRTLAARQAEVLARWGLAKREYYLATVHRAENTADAGELIRLLRTLARLDRPTLLPLHPRTRTVLERAGWRPSRRGRLRLVKPLAYLDMLALERSARAILTDSGGVQKEAYVWGVPCLTLRQETEWVETLRQGRNRLVGLEPRAIREGLATVNGRWRSPAPSVYGRGKAAQAIVSHLRWALQDRP